MIARSLDEALAAITDGSQPRSSQSPTKSTTKFGSSPASPRNERRAEGMKLICLTLLPILALAVPSLQAGAQSWPTRPIRAIVPYTAGSGTDVTARVILNQLSSELGQSIIVENRVGAGGTIGTAAAAKAEPDGYTILVQSSALTIAPAIYQNLTYDTERDLVAVAPLGISPNVLIISPSRGIKTVHELVSAAKAKSFTFASAGVGTNTHLSAERFRLRAGFEAVHVP